MAAELFIPKLGQTVEEVTIVNWLVADGAAVKAGQDLLEVETDKAVFPIESPAKGWLHIGPYPNGAVVPVLTVVALVGAQDERFVQAHGVEAEPQVIESPAVPQAVEAPVQPEAAAPAGKTFASPRARRLAAAEGVDLSQVPPSGGGGVRVIERDVVDFLAQQPKVTPLARRVAEAAGVDWHGLAGSGPGGRIVREDVARALQERAAPLSSDEILVRLPLAGARAVIAERMSASARATARVTMMMEVDASELVAARERLKARVEKEWGFAPSYNDLLARMCAAALRRFPYMNARLAVDAVEVLSRVNIGLAVDTERGLLVPVVRDVDRKSLRQFGSEFRVLVEKARNNRILPDDLSGGTFTITNLGMFDIEAFTPVINLPEAAILGVGRILPKPVARGEGVVVRQMMTLSLAFDHRLVDGAPAARFFQYLKQLVEEPYLLLAEG